jgi:hypothetical protein
LGGYVSSTSTDRGYRLRRKPGLPPALLVYYAATGSLKLSVVRNIQRQAARLIASGIRVGDPDDHRRTAM